jgi:FkbM family methyltransferase
VSLLKSISSYLPDNMRYELKRWYYRYLIKRDKFESDEPEYMYIEKLLTAGDWVIDIGANIGTYTAKFSKLVGNTGRVIAFEPIPQTFNILYSNALLFPYQNTNLINAAASNYCGFVNMNVPSFPTGQKIYTQARIVNGEEGNSGMKIFCILVDSLDLPKRIKMIKIDAEGHELNVIMGMINLIKRDKPILIIEGDSPEIEQTLCGLDYNFQQLPKSPNKIFSISDCS